VTAAPQLELAFDSDALAAHRARWRDGAARLHFGFCRCCGRYHDDDGRPLLVARQLYARRFLCFFCYWGTLPKSRRRAA
jgi:hypothetical protein